MGISRLSLHIDLEFCKILSKLPQKIFGKLKTFTQNKLAPQPTVIRLQALVPPTTYGMPFYCFCVLEEAFISIIFELSVIFYGR